MVYLNCCYGYFKSVRLCVSLLVRNFYISDLCFEFVIFGVLWVKLFVIFMFWEMVFFVFKGESWYDCYVYVWFLSNSLKVFFKLIDKSCLFFEVVFLGLGL